MRWISSYSKNPIKYINVGDSAYYKGWKRPRKNEQYFSFSIDGAVGAVYRLVNNEWRGTTGNLPYNYDNEYFLDNNESVNNTLQCLYNNKYSTIEVDIINSNNVDVEILDLNNDCRIVTKAQRSDFDLTGNLVVKLNKGYLVDKWYLNDKEVKEWDGLTVVHFDVKNSQIYTVTYKPEVTTQVRIKVKPSSQISLDDLKMAFKITLDGIEVDSIDITEDYSNQFLATLSISEEPNVILNAQCTISFEKSEITRCILFDLTELNIINGNVVEKQFSNCFLNPASLETTIYPTVV